MIAPAPVTRAVMLERDAHRCLVCGKLFALEAQHRRAVGMGGSTTRPLIADLVTACSTDNAAFEAEKQTVALKFGWKVRKWVKQPELVPVFFLFERQWCELTTRGTRIRISHSEAMAMMHDVYGDAYVVGKGLVA